MTQGVRGPQVGQVSSQQSLTMAKRTGIVPGHTVLSILNVTPPLFYANKMLHDSGML